MACRVSGTREQPGSGAHPLLHRPGFVAVKISPSCLPGQHGMEKMLKSLAQSSRSCSVTRAQVRQARCAIRGPPQASEGDPDTGMWAGQAACPPASPGLGVPGRNPKGPPSTWPGPPRGWAPPRGGWCLWQDPGKVPRGHRSTDSQCRGGCPCRRVEEEEV